MPRKHPMLQYRAGRGQRIESRPAQEMNDPRDIAIQKALGDPGRSSLQKYQDLVVGSRGLGRLLLYEIVMLTTSWVPGALGLLLRRLCYPLLLGSVGRNPTFGQGVVLREGRVLATITDSAHLTMRPFSDAFLDRYLAAAGPEVTSSVGAYRLEELGAQLFERIEGDYFTILGLPLLPLLSFLRTERLIPS